MNQNKTQARIFL